MQEVNDFLQALFGFVLTGNIGKFDGLAILNDILFGTGFAAAKIMLLAPPVISPTRLRIMRLNQTIRMIMGSSEMTQPSRVSTQVVWLYTLPKETPALSNRLTSCRSCAMELVQ